MLLSPVEGRFHAVARGSRRASSSLVGRLEPFTVLNAQFARGRGELDHLTQARALRSFGRLRQDLDRLTYGSYFLQLFRNCVPFREPARRLFRLLMVALETLEQGASPPSLARWLELRLAAELGYAPGLDACVECDAPQATVFSPTAGGVICRGCRPSRGLPLSPAALAALRHLSRTSASAAGRLRLAPEAAEQVEEALHAHLKEHWPSHLSAVKVLRSLA